ncbi:hypothetical protein MtrunA17_Chr3g0144841 [Medicago truncatula]|uniref:Vicilin n=1 Tax=Medicago truncatula TaxID=3880 RepID=A0A072VE15_MEDTR|nr:Vicilin [Medicago truncatula]RHN71308.1 hypothetical protein MtrunA17_Chr3g0144841 [Medicago truncatula]
MAKTSTVSLVLLVLAVALILNGYSASAEGEVRANQLVKDEVGTLNSAAAEGDGRVNQLLVKDEADQLHDDDDKSHKSRKKIIIKLIFIICINYNKLCGIDKSYCSQYNNLCRNIHTESIVAKSGNPNAEILP